MSAHALLAKVRNAGMTLGVEGAGEDVRIVWEADHEPPAPLLAELRRHKSELIAVLSAQASCSAQDNQDAASLNAGLHAGDDLEERAAIIAEGAGVPRAWAEGYGALTALPLPARFTPERWQRVVDAAGVFLDCWAVEAARCGWSELDVFGCHDIAPTARFDCKGLLLSLDRCSVVAIDECGADLVAPSGSRQRFYRRPLPVGTVSLWELAETR